MAELDRKAEAPPSLDTIFRTNIGTISGLSLLKEEIDLIVNSDGTPSPDCESKCDAVDPIPTISVIQKQADVIKILTDEINHLMTILRGNKHG